MWPCMPLYALPASLLALLLQATAAQHAPTAIKKLSPDSGEKLLAEHMAFSPFVLPFISSLDDNLNVTTTRFYRRAFAPHVDDGSSNVLRRAAEALAILRRQSSCPSGTNPCLDIGAPDKCCQDGTYCTEVPDESVGQVACCPQGGTCGGGVGECPGDSTSCPASLGGGCCIAGYVCQGSGCIRSELAFPSPTTTQTQVTTRTQDESPHTITTTRTTVIDGEQSTVVVTLTVTEEPPIEPTTVTRTEIITASGPSTETVTASATRTVTGGAPFRPTTEPASSTNAPSSESDTTQQGCPTGFYGCLATHGGGCCRTDRNCETHSCPAPDRTTVVDAGATIVVPADDVPPTAEATCADGWFLCGADAGPVAGCCPEGFDCGTASCFTVSSSQTGQVQKVFPDEAAASSGAQAYSFAVMGTLAMMMVFL
ncbi:hypothetical protein S40285_03880 [Stachybotrys chlorohalonatus IBT 40285]|uniref:GPI anchored protein n=1 Tax=Stachybotrys chlorohalonatus (strain IBT 40285) TaxID=1283841 RepID=A0A084QLX6_STAC4|nr:hypothetical protein S40285_03880 [Stachybotrys chlorohalonata IBT 40285]